MLEGENMINDKPLKSPSRKLRCCMTALLPSFLLPAIHGTPSTTAKISPTAWLDGMRGWAAFFVFLRHFEFAYFRKGAFVYGTIEDPNYPNANRHLLQLPILRLINAGEAMVCIFFVVSGYTLSLKSLKLIRQSSHGQLLHALASSIFRRPFRLFLPCIASTAIIFICLRIGVFDYPNLIAEDEATFRYVFWGWAHEPQPHVFATFQEQFWNYCEATKGLLNIMTHEHWPSHGYDIHLWTIPVEFRCSMVLFLTIAGLAMVRTRVRLITVAALVVCSFQFDVFELGLFWGGMLLAELNLIREEKASANEWVDEEMSAFRIKSKRQEEENSDTIWYCLFILSLLLLSFPPEKAQFAPIYSTLLEWSPSGLRPSERHRFWTSIGAMLLIWSTNNNETLQKPFSCALGRYLGNISYALYLMHGLVNRTLGYSTVFNVWENITGKETPAQYQTGVVLGGLVVVPATIWVADLFWRYVDLPMVRFARSIENKVLAPMNGES